MTPGRISVRADDGQLWLFDLDGTPRSLATFCDEIERLTRAPTNGFTECLAKNALNALARHLCDVARAESSRRAAIARTLRGTSMTSSPIE